MATSAGLALICSALIFSSNCYARPGAIEEIDAAATDPNDNDSDSMVIEPRFAPPELAGGGQQPPPQAFPLQRFINNPEARNATFNSTFNNGTIGRRFDFRQQNAPNARGGGGYGGYDGGGGYGGGGDGGGGYGGNGGGGYGGGGYGGGDGGGYGGYGGGGGYGFAPGLLFGEESGFFQGPPPDIICGQMGGRGAPYWVLERCRQMGIPIVDNLGALAARKYGNSYGGGFGGGLIGRSLNRKKHIISAESSHHSEEKKSVSHHEDKDEFSADASF